MLMTRRDWLHVAGQTALLGQASPVCPDIQLRIAKIISAYEVQGNHRTGTKVDQVSGDWLASEVRQSCLKATSEAFRISRIDPIAASLSADGRRVEGIPLFDAGFTEPAGITGRLGLLGSEAAIGLTEGAPNTSGTGPLGESRRQGRHRAIVMITRGGRSGLCPSSAESFLHPFGPPVLQVSSDQAEWLADLASRSSEVTLVASVKRTPTEAFNLMVSVLGTNRALPPLVIMTPRSGWWSCASERGGGIACWLELMRAMRGTKPARDVLFVPSSGHELGQLGSEIYTERLPRLIKRSRAWIHLGANIGAAQQPGNTLQASDYEMENTLAIGMVAAGLEVNRRVPHGTVPLGEAGVVHCGGGRYLSVIGGNALLHNPVDRGPEAVDTNVIARFVVVFTHIAQVLAGVRNVPHRTSSTEEARADSQTLYHRLL